MDSKLLLTLSELLTECPKCMKTSLDRGGLTITPTEISRSCNCGYTIKLNIEENYSAPQKPKSSILRG